MNSTAKRPAFQFYPGDWKRDTGLQVCSLGARGLWIEMIGIMHFATPYGLLRVEGQDVTTDELARLVGSTPREAKKLLGELEARHVFSRTESGTIYSRRMVQDEHIREVRATAGKTGGNPALVDPPPVKQRDKPLDNDLVKQTDKQILTPAVAVAVASAVAGTTDTDSLTTARDALRERMPNEYRGDLDRLLERMRSDGARLSWVYNLAQLLQDETPNGPQVPTEVAVLGAAIRQFNGAEETSWIRYCGYVRRVTSEPAQNSAAGGMTQPSGHRPTLPRGGRVTASDRISAIIAGSTNGSTKLEGNAP